LPLINYFKNPKGMPVYEEIGFDHFALRAQYIGDRRIAHLVLQPHLPHGRA
jgi:hypothetical protein